MATAEANLIRNEITNYITDISTIQDKRQEIQETYDNAMMHELAMEETAVIKTLVRGTKNN